MRGSRNFDGAEKRMARANGTLLGVWLMVGAPQYEIFAGAVSGRA